MSIVHSLPPSFWFAVSSIIGITLAHHLPIPLAIAGIACTLIVLEWIQIWFAKIGYLRFYSGVCAGAFALTCFYEQNHTQFLNRYKKQTVSVRGIITHYAHTPHLTMPHRILCRVDHINLKNDLNLKLKQQHASFSFMINSSENYHYLVGSTVEINDIMMPAIKGDFKQFCLRNGIIGSLSLPRLNINIITYPYYSWYRSIDSVRHNLMRTFKHSFSRDTFIFFSVLFMGNSDETKKDIKKYQSEFQRWGIIHYLARSGLHLIIVTLALEYIVALIPLSFFIRRVIIIVSAALYWLCTWPTISFYRALVLFLMINISMIQRRLYQFLHLLFVVCSLFLIINPFHLFFLDFQLTFGLTAALALFNSHNNQFS